MQKYEVESIIWSYEIDAEYFKIRLIRDKLILGHSGKTNDEIIKKGNFPLNRSKLKEIRTHTRYYKVRDVRLHIKFSSLNCKNSKKTKLVQKLNKIVNSIIKLTYMCFRRAYSLFITNRAKKQKFCFWRVGFTMPLKNVATRTT